MIQEITFSSVLSFARTSARMNEIASGSVFRTRPRDRASRAMNTRFAAIMILTLFGSWHRSALSQESDPVVLRFGGDCLLTTHYEWWASSDVTRAFRQLRHLETADVAMVNLESPVTRRGTKREKPFTFRMDPRFLESFTSAGIDLVTIANNHIYDFDSIGLLDTIHNLDSAGIGHVGAGMTKQDARKPALIDVRGTRIAFLAYYNGSEAPNATDSTAGVAERSLPVIREDMMFARTELGADVVVVNLHWGIEKAVLPDPEQVLFARAVIDAGVDVVVGHHPHVLQPIEVYNEGVIAYSLGNLVFGGNSRHTYDTALLEIRITGSTITHSVIPVRVEQYGARFLEGEGAKRLLDSLNTLTLSLRHD